MVAQQAIGRIALAIMAAGLAAAFFVTRSFDQGAVPLPAQTDGCIRTAIVDIPSTKEPPPSDNVPVDLVLAPGSSVLSVIPDVFAQWCRRDCGYCPYACTDEENARCISGEGVIDGCAQPIESCDSVNTVFIDSDNRPMAGGMGGSGGQTTPQGATGLYLYITDSPYEDNVGTCSAIVTYYATGAACAPGPSSASTASHGSSHSSSRSSSRPSSSGEYSAPSSGVSLSAFSSPASRSFSSASQSSSNMADFEPLGSWIEPRQGQSLVVHYEHRNIGSLDAGASRTVLSFDTNFDGRYERMTTVSEAALEAGGSVVRASLPTRIASPRVKVLICSDNDDAVPESSSTNNCVELCYREGSGDTSCAGEASSASGTSDSSSYPSSQSSSSYRSYSSRSSSSSSALPDLVPFAPFYAKVVGKTDCTITAGVANIGGAPSGATFLSMFIDLDGDGNVGDWIADTALNDLHPPEQLMVPFLQSPCKLPVDEEFMVRVCADVKDAYSRVPEEDEGNNCTDYTLTWPGVCGDGIVPALHYLTEQCDDGARNVPKSLANRASVESFSAQDIEKLKASSCLDSCSFAKCGDTQDNDDDGSADGADSVCKHQGQYVKGRDFETDECKPLFGGNAQPRGNAMNVVFRFAGVRPEDGKETAKGWVGEMNAYVPFSANANAIQYWYHTREFTGVSDTRCRKPSDAAACPGNMPNVKYVDVDAASCRANANFFGGISMASSDDGATFTHEMGHAVGGLADEYTEAGAGDFPSAPNCAPTTREAIAMWGSLEGGGVSYYSGCSYTDDNWRPTEESVMKSPWAGASAAPNGFYRVNIRALRTALSPYGSSVVGMANPALAQLIDGGSHSFAEAAFAVDLSRDGESFSVEAVRPVFVLTGVKPVLYGDASVILSIGGRTWTQGVRTADIMIVEDFSSSEGIRLVSHEVVSHESVTAYVGLGAVVPVAEDAVTFDSSGTVLVQGLEKAWPDDIDTSLAEAEFISCDKTEDCSAPRFLDREVIVGLDDLPVENGDAQQWLPVAIGIVAFVAVIGSTLFIIVRRRRAKKSA